MGAVDADETEWQQLKPVHRATFSIHPVRNKVLGSVLNTNLLILKPNAKLSPYNIVLKRSTVESPQQRPAE